MNRKIVTPLMMMMMLSGCSEKPTDTTDTTAETEGAELVGLEFLLDSGFDPIEGTTIYLGFDLGYTGALELNVSAGCNSIGGFFELDDGVLVMSSLWSTEMWCGDELQAQDEWIADFLTSSPLLELSGDYLTLTGPDDTLVFIDREVSDADRPLAGTDWTVDTYIVGDSATTFSLDEYPWFLFGDDGTVQVFNGCNQGAGDYTTDGNMLTFIDVAFTEKYCKDKSAAWAEAHILSVIAGGSATYTIDAARLTIDQGSVGISAYGE